MLDDLGYLTGVLRGKEGVVVEGSFPRSICAGDMYCPPCGGLRRMDITPIYWPLGRYTCANVYSIILQQGTEALVPSLFDFSCVQCETRFTAVIYRGAKGPALAVLPSCRGGLTTPHTPDGVAFYLDQAHKAQSIGANSAAVAMFRGALEHLLFDQGYKKGMAGQKITDLEKDTQAGKAPKWAMDLDPAFLKVLKDLGAGAIHPNDGNVENQVVLDNELLAQLKATFLEVLDGVYEAEGRRKERLAALQAAAATLQKP